MAVLIDGHTRVLVQGITGRTGAFQTELMQAYGTRVVAGVTPGKGGQVVKGVPVYDLVAEAVADHAVDAAICFVPGRLARDAVIEAVDGGIGFIVLPTEGIPEQDLLTLLHFAESRAARVLGPDTPGLISPGKCKLGGHPAPMFQEGRVGVLSKSGSLSYEVSRVLTVHGIGQSTVVGIGGGPLWGLSQETVLDLFENDPETDAVVLLGEVGGTMEHRAAEHIARYMQKPVVAMIVGRMAPAGARMGHAGAIVEGEEGTAASKTAALEKAGALVARSSLEIPDLIRQCLGG
jgi:succinyl-CoA synthetase alpha subunit